MSTACEPALIELQARTLERAAAHLQDARMYDWAGRPRKMTGWGAAAGELRAIAAHIRRHGDFPGEKRDA